MKKYNISRYPNKMSLNKKVEDILKCMDEYDEIGDFMDDLFENPFTRFYYKYFKKK